MCGISGIISRTSIVPAELARMNSAIRHRGPDDEGYLLAGNEAIPLGGDDTRRDAWDYSQPSRPIAKLTQMTGDYFLGLGHRRLSILDLSARGHQPATEPTKNYWLTFNGEIYNFRELRSELAGRGYNFQTDSDTEVLLASYLAWGVECLHRLEGMWAFAIYDCAANRLLLARDRFGIKPLYYWTAPSGDFYFGSEIKQFTNCNQWRAKLERQAASDYLLYSLTDHQVNTLFEDVFHIRAGHYLEVDLTNFRKQPSWSPTPVKWYQLPEKIFQGDEREALDEFQSRFFQSLSEHLVADVPVGAALSGGVDSSAITCGVAQLLQQRGASTKLATFSSCAHDPVYDESPWVREVLKRIPAEPHLIYPRGEDIFSLSERLIWHMDEPYQSQSAFLAWHVFEAARNAGVPVVLNGQGADEYTSCYGETAMLIQRLQRYSFRHPIQLIRQLFGSPNPGWRWHLNQLAIPLLPAWLSNTFRSFTLPRELPSGVIDRSLLGASRRHPYSLDGYRKRSITEISRHQLHQEPLPKYLRWEDRNSMAHSVEARVPFLDRRLVEFTRSLPASFLVGPTRPKKIITESLSAILPAAIRNRPDKVGFISSEKRWFLQDFHKEFQEMLLANLDAAQGIIVKEQALDYFAKLRSGRLPFSYGYWRIILFCQWMRVFNVSL
jgi:asparagine synthase (glutamine-hydrolysing)